MVVRLVHASKDPPPCLSHAQPVAVALPAGAESVDECGIGGGPRHADRLFGDGAGGARMLVLAGGRGAAGGELQEGQTAAKSG